MKRPERWCVSPRARGRVLSTLIVVVVVQSTLMPLSTCTCTVATRLVGSLRVSTLTLKAAGAPVAAPSWVPDADSATTRFAPVTFVVPRSAIEPCTQGVRGVSEQVLAGSGPALLLKTAVTARSASSVVEQAPLPLHAPLQPRKNDPGAGVAM